MIWEMQYPFEISREKKNERRERERELYLVTFFLDLSCVTKHPFNQSNEKLTKYKINIFL